MKKAIKWILYSLLSLTVLLVAAAFIIPPLIPKDAYIKHLITEVRKATGRELTIAGDVGFALLPNLTLALSDVRFANVPNAAQPVMLALEQLDLSLKLIPLLGGNIEIDQFVLTRPQIHLEIDAHNNPNWLFPGLSSDQRSITEQPLQTGTAEKSPPTHPIDSQESDHDSYESDSAPLAGLQLQLGDVRLDQATITYTDNYKNIQERLEQVSMTLHLPSLDAPFSAEGGLVWRAQEISLELETGALRTLLEGGTTPTKMILAGSPVNLSFEGAVQNTQQFKVDGKLDLQIPSVRGLAAWTGNPLAPSMGETGLGLLAITGQVKVDGPHYGFQQAQFSLDTIRAQGQFAADLSAAIPALSGKLAVEMLDLNPYLPKEDLQTEEPTQARKSKQEPSPATPQQWSREPIDFSVLRTVNLDLELAVQEIRYQKIKIGQGNLAVKLSNGLMTANLQQLKLYDGSVTGQISVNGKSKIAQMVSNLNLTGVQANPLLTDAADFSKLEGVSNVGFNIKSNGRSQAELIRNLAGDGKFAFRDGAIIGINIGSIIRNAKNLIRQKINADNGSVSKTDFTELSGSVTIRDGVATNQDLKMLAPLFRLSGTGSTDLHDRLVKKYRLLPKLISSTKGQGGTSDAKGVMIPILISGPWHDLSYRPDFSGGLPNIKLDTETIRNLAPELIGKEDKTNSRPKLVIPDPAKILDGLFGK